MSFCWHKWSKWEWIQSGGGLVKLINVYDSGDMKEALPIAQFYVQRRACAKCCLEQFKRIYV